MCSVPLSPRFNLIVQITRKKRLFENENWGKLQIIGHQFGSKNIQNKTKQNPSSLKAHLTVYDF